MDKEIYRIFRRFNIVEYKNPHDQLNWRVIDKVIGYGHLYAGLAENEEERPRDQITISIFRAVKNPDLFKELEQAGNLVPDETNGIYHVVGLTDFPFQIVIMSELVGDEYAAERAMIDRDRASVEDIQRLMDEYNQEIDENTRNQMKVILRLISEKNPDKFDELLRRDTAMSPRLLEVLQPYLEERDKERDKKRDKEIEKNNLFSYVEEGGMTLEFAAGRLKESVSQFASEMKQSGYTVPGQAV